MDTNIALIAMIIGIVGIVIDAIVNRKELRRFFIAIKPNLKDISESTIKAIAYVGRRSWRFIVITIGATSIAIWIDRYLIVNHHEIVTFLDISLSILSVASIFVIFYFLIVEPKHQSKEMKQKLETWASLFNGAMKNVTVKPYVFYDPELPTTWVDAPEIAARFFNQRGFVIVDSESIHDFMERDIDQGTAFNTAFVFTQDIVPINITRVNDPTCTLGRFLRAGGRVVWWGDIPLHYRGIGGGQREPWIGAHRVLGVNHYSPITTRQGAARNALWDREDLEGMIQNTEAGIELGIDLPSWCIRPAIVDEETIVYSELIGDLGMGAPFDDMRYAISWRKVYNLEYPHSGFMQYPCGRINCDDESVVENYFKFANSNWVVAHI